MLFFAGWGMDHHPFEHYIPHHMDFAVCYDYQSLELDWSFFVKYKEIHLVAWSMGVWAASHCDITNHLPIKTCIAINGTITPVNNLYGIPEKIYQGTLTGLNENTLRKFQLRMCGGSDAFKSFQRIAPQRSLENIKDELRLIGEQTQLIQPNGLIWDKAHVGLSDHIFPADNQIVAWRKLGVNISCTNEPHYDEMMFKHYLDTNFLLTTLE